MTFGIVNQAANVYLWWWDRCLHRMCSCSGLRVPRIDEQWWRLCWSWMKWEADVCNACRPRCLRMSTKPNILYHLTPKVIGSCAYSPHKRWSTVFNSKVWLRWRNSYFVFLCSIKPFTPTKLILVFPALLKIESTLCLSKPVFERELDVVSQWWPPLSHE